MVSRRRFVAILSLLAVLFLAVGPFGIGVATIPVLILPVSPGECSDPLVGSTVPQARRAATHLLPSRAPPLA